MSNQKGKKQSKTQGTASGLEIHARRMDELTSVAKAYIRFISAFGALTSVAIATAISIGVGFEGIL